MKILYLLPHCSTGGMPQYVLKQIESLKDQHTIYVVEVDYYGDLYTVQRKQIERICTFLPLFNNQSKLQDTITTINPDVIHCQEVPNTFLNDSSLRFLYKRDRTWYVVVTTHSSLTRPTDFSHYPDRIIAVNKWQKDLFASTMPEVSVEMWEYPIEKKVRNKFDAIVELGFPEEKDWPHYHILNVGLFTPGKNQGELFQIARKNPQNAYHFVGNQAENFKNYWQPLMANKPDNCYVWGERNDVDLFYQACDEMYFTSNFELNPICVKEALSYGMPVKMKKLHTYGTDYDNNPLVTYI